MKVDKVLIPDQNVTTKPNHATICHDSASVMTLDPDVELEFERVVEFVIKWHAQVADKRLIQPITDLRILTYVRT